MAKKNKKLEKRLFWFVFPISIFFSELILRIKVFGFGFDEGLLYTLLFSVSAGLLATAICTFFKSKTGNVLSIIGLSLVFVGYGSQIVYHEIFKKFYTLFSLQGAGEAMKGFTNSMFKGILISLPLIVLCALPLAFYLVLRKKKLKPRRTKIKSTILLVLCSAALYLFSVLLISLSKDGAPSTKSLYFNTFAVEQSVGRFGLLTSARLDFQHLVFKYKDEIDDEIPDVPVVPPVIIVEPEQPDEPQPVIDPEEPDSKAVFVPVDNVMNIDFETLLNEETDDTYIALNKYFSSLSPTKTNEYTGLFEGKNLIMMTCEAFSPYAVRPDTTPTLYKLMTEGFYFTNFYTPSWPVSTSDGEYVACTGLIPKSGVWSFYRSGDNLMPLCMGNSLKKLGYRTLAYHNNTYTYYNRDVSHPNMGYIYKGYGNGLNVRKTWPESDLEMMQLTADEYMHNTPFHAYYMTVSGHMEYTWIDNYMSSKHKQEVLDLNLPYSERCLGYLACNMELDKALEYLLQRLNELGIAEDTVIVMSPDHIPYGLTTEEYNEFAGRELDPDLEYYQSVLIMYCQGMEPQTVDKICCSLDIIPTISNLFGLDYDSRLLMGYDIFSTAPGLVIFDNYSWLSDAGFYNARTRKFIPAEGIEVDDSYISSMNKIVSNKFKYSAKILETDYYGYLEDKLGLWQMK